MEEFNIYDDLDEFQEQEEKKSKELQDVEAKHEEALNTIDDLQTENKALKKKIKRIEVNFQSLLDTARREIQRKDKEIDRLRKENDDICFRRKAPMRQKDSSKEIPAESDNQQVAAVSNQFKWQQATETSTADALPQTKTEHTVSSQRDADVEKLNVRVRSRSPDRYKSRRRHDSRETYDSDRARNGERNRAKDRVHSSDHSSSKQYRSNEVAERGRIRQRSRSSDRYKTDTKRHCNRVGNDDAQHSLYHKHAESDSKNNTRNKDYKTNSHKHEDDKSYKHSRDHSGNPLSKNERHHKSPVDQTNAHQKDFQNKTLLGSKNDRSLKLTNSDDNTKHPCLNGNSYKESELPQIDDSEENQQDEDSIKCTATSLDAARHSSTKQSSSVSFSNVHKSNQFLLTTPKRDDLFDELFGPSPTVSNSSSLLNSGTLSKNSLYISSNTTSPSQYTDSNCEVETPKSENIIKSQMDNEERHDIDKCFIKIDTAPSAPPSIVDQIDLTLMYSDEITGKELNYIQIPGLDLITMPTLKQKSKSEEIKETMVIEEKTVLEEVSSNLQRELVSDLPDSDLLRTKVLDHNPEDITKSTTKQGIDIIALEDESPDVPKRIVTEEQSIDDEVAQNTEMKTISDPSVSDVITTESLNQKLNPEQVFSFSLRSDVTDNQSTPKEELSDFYKENIKITKDQDKLLPNLKDLSSVIKRKQSTDKEELLQNIQTETVSGHPSLELITTSVPPSNNTEESIKKDKEIVKLDDFSAKSVIAEEQYADKVSDISALVLIETESLNPISEEIEKKTKDQDESLSTKLAKYVVTEEQSTHDVSPKNIQQETVSCLPDLDLMLTEPLNENLKENAKITEEVIKEIINWEDFSTKSVVIEEKSDVSVAPAVDSITTELLNPKSRDRINTTQAGLSSDFTEFVVTKEQSTVFDLPDLDFVPIEPSTQNPEDNGTFITDEAREIVILDDLSPKILKPVVTEQQSGVSDVLNLDIIATESLNQKLNPGETELTEEHEEEMVILEDLSPKVPECVVADEQSANADIPKNIQNEIVSDVADLDLMSAETLIKRPAENNTTTEGNINSEDLSSIVSKCVITEDQYAAKEVCDVPALDSITTKSLKQVPNPGEIIEASKDQDKEIPVLDDLSSNVSDSVVAKEPSTDGKIPQNIQKETVSDVADLMSTEKCKENLEEIRNITENQHKEIINSEDLSPKAVITENQSVAEEVCDVSVLDSITTKTLNPNPGETIKVTQDQDKETIMLDDLSSNVPECVIAKYQSTDQEVPQNIQNETVSDVADLDFKSTEILNKNLEENLTITENQHKEINNSEDLFPKVANSLVEDDQSVDKEISDLLFSNVRESLQEQSTLEGVPKNIQKEIVSDFQDLDSMTLNKNPEENRKINEEHDKEIINSEVAKSAVTDEKSVNKQVYDLLALDSITELLNKSQNPEEIKRSTEDLDEEVVILQDDEKILQNIHKETVSQVADLDLIPMETFNKNVEENRKISEEQHKEIFNSENLSQKPANSVITEVQSVDEEVSNLLTLDSITTETLNHTPELTINATKEPEEEIANLKDLSPKVPVCSVPKEQSTDKKITQNIQRESNSDKTLFKSPEETITITQEQHKEIINSNDLSSEVEKSLVAEEQYVNENVSHIFALDSITQLLNKSKNAEETARVTKDEDEEIVTLQDSPSKVPKCIVATEQSPEDELQKNFHKETISDLGDLEVISIETLNKNPQENRKSNECQQKHIIDSQDLYPKVAKPVVAEKLSVDIEIFELTALDSITTESINKNPEEALKTTVSNPADLDSITMETLNENPEQNIKIIEDQPTLDSITTQSLNSNPGEIIKVTKEQDVEIIMLEDLSPKSAEQSNVDDVPQNIQKQTSSDFPDLDPEEYKKIAKEQHKEIINLEDVSVKCVVINEQSEADNQIMKVTKERNKEIAILEELYPKVPERVVEKEETNNVDEEVSIITESDSITSESLHQNSNPEDITKLTKEQDKETIRKDISPKVNKDEEVDEFPQIILKKIVSKLPCLECEEDNTKNSQLSDDLTNEIILNSTAVNTEEAKENKKQCEINDVVEEVICNSEQDVNDAEASDSCVSLKVCYKKACYDKDKVSKSKDNTEANFKSVICSSITSLDQPRNSEKEKTFLEDAILNKAEEGNETSSSLRDYVIQSNDNATKECKNGSEFVDLQTLVEARMENTSNQLNVKDNQSEDINQSANIPNTDNSDGKDNEAAENNNYMHSKDIENIIQETETCVTSSRPTNQLIVEDNQSQEINHSADVPNTDNSDDKDNGAAENNNYMDSEDIEGIIQETKTCETSFKTTNQLIVEDNQSEDINQSADVPNTNNSDDKDNGAAENINYMDSEDSESINQEAEIYSTTSNTFLKINCPEAVILVLEDKDEKLPETVDNLKQNINDDIASIFNAKEVISSLSQQEECGKSFTEPSSDKTSETTMEHCNNDIAFKSKEINSEDINNEGSLNSNSIGKEKVSDIKKTGNSSLSLCLTTSEIEKQTDCRENQAHRNIISDFPSNENDKSLDNIPSSNGNSNNRASTNSKDSIQLNDEPNSEEVLQNNQKDLMLSSNNKEVSKNDKSNMSLCSSSVLNPNHDDSDDENKIQKPSASAANSEILKNDNLITTTNADNKTDNNEVSSNTNEINQKDDITKKVSASEGSESNNSILRLCSTELYHQAQNNIVGNTSENQIDDVSTEKKIANANYSINKDQHCLSSDRKLQKLDNLRLCSTIANSTPDNASKSKSLMTSEKKHGHVNKSFYISLLGLPSELNVPDSNKANLLLYSPKNSNGVSVSKDTNLNKDECYHKDVNDNSSKLKITENTNSTLKPSADGNKLKEAMHVGLPQPLASACIVDKNNRDGSTIKSLDENRPTTQNTTVANIRSDQNSNLKLVVNCEEINADCNLNQVNCAKKTIEELIPATIKTEPVQLCDISTRPSRNEELSKMNLEHVANSTIKHTEPKIPTTSNQLINQTTKEIHKLQRPALPSLPKCFDTPINFSGLFNNSKKRQTKPKEYILPAASVLCNADNLENATKPAAEKQAHCSQKKLHWELLADKNEMTEIEDDTDIESTDEDKLEIAEDEEVQTKSLQELNCFGYLPPSSTSTDVESDLEQSFPPFRTFAKKTAALPLRRYTIDAINISEAVSPNQQKHYNKLSPKKLRKRKVLRAFPTIHVRKMNNKDLAVQPKRKRGRPRKHPLEEQLTLSTKRKRGRPRKIPITAEDVERNETTTNQENSKEEEDENEQQLNVCEENQLQNVYETNEKYVRNDKESIMNKEFNNCEENEYITDNEDDDDEDGGRHKMVKQQSEKPSFKETTNEQKNPEPNLRAETAQEFVPRAQDQSFKETLSEHKKPKTTLKSKEFVESSLKQSFKETVCEQKKTEPNLRAKENFKSQEFAESPSKTQREMLEENGNTELKAQLNNQSLEQTLEPMFYKENNLKTSGETLANDSNNTDKLQQKLISKAEQHPNFSYSNDILEQPSKPMYSDGNYCEDERSRETESPMPIANSSSHNQNALTLSNYFHSFEDSPEIPTEEEPHNNELLQFSDCFPSFEENPDNYSAPQLHKSLCDEGIFEEMARETAVNNIESDLVEENSEPECNKYYQIAGNEIESSCQTQTAAESKSSKNSSLQILSNELLTKPCMDLKNYKIPKITNSEEISSSCTSINNKTKIISLEDIGINMRSFKGHLSSFRIPKIKNDAIPDKSWKVETYIELASNANDGLDRENQNKEKITEAQMSCKSSTSQQQLMKQRRKSMFVEGSHYLDAEERVNDKGHHRDQNATDNNRRHVKRSQEETSSKASYSNNCLEKEREQSTYAERNSYESAKNREDNAPRHYKTTNASRHDYEGGKDRARDSFSKAHSSNDSRNDYEREKYRGTERASRDYKSRKEYEREKDRERDRTSRGHKASKIINTSRNEYESEKNRARDRTSKAHEASKSTNASSNELEKDRARDRCSRDHRIINSSSNEYDSGKDRGRNSDSKDHTTNASRNEYKRETHRERDTTSKTPNSRKHDSKQRESSGSSQSRKSLYDEKTSHGKTEDEKRNRSHLRNPKTLKDTEKEYCTRRHQSNADEKRKESMTSDRKNITYSETLKDKETDFLARQQEKIRTSNRSSSSSSSFDKLNKERRKSFYVERNSHELEIEEPLSKAQIDEDTTDKAHISCPSSCAKPEKQRRKSMYVDGNLCKTLENKDETEVIAKNQLDSCEIHYDSRFTQKKKETDSQEENIGTSHRSSSSSSSNKLNKERRKLDSIQGNSSESNELESKISKINRNKEDKHTSLSTTKRRKSMHTDGNSYEISDNRREKETISKNQLDSFKVQQTSKLTTIESSSNQLVKQRTKSMYVERNIYKDGGDEGETMSEVQNVSFAEKEHAMHQISSKIQQRRKSLYVEKNLQKTADCEPNQETISAVPDAKLTKMTIERCHIIRKHENISPKENPKITPTILESHNKSMHNSSMPLPTDISVQKLHSKDVSNPLLLIKSKPSSQKQSRQILNTSSSEEDGNLLNTSSNAKRLSNNRSKIIRARRKSINHIKYSSSEEDIPNGKIGIPNKNITLLENPCHQTTTVFPVSKESGKPISCAETEKDQKSKETEKSISAVEALSANKVTKRPRRKSMYVDRDTKVHDDPKLAHQIRNRSSNHDDSLASKNSVITSNKLDENSFEAQQFNRLSQSHKGLESNRLQSQIFHELSTSEHSQLRNSTCLERQLSLESAQIPSQSRVFHELSTVELDLKTVEQRNTKTLSSLTEKNMLCEQKFISSKQTKEEEKCLDSSSGSKIINKESFAKQNVLNELGNSVATIPQVELQQTAEKQAIHQQSTPNNKTKKRKRRSVKVLSTSWEECGGAGQEMSKKHKLNEEILTATSFGCQSPANTSSLAHDERFRAVDAQLSELFQSPQYSEKDLQQASMLPMQLSSEDQQEEPISLSAEQHLNIPPHQYNESLSQCISMQSSHLNLSSPYPIQNITIEETICPNQENNQSTMNVNQTTADISNTSDVKHLSMGASEYRIEKISDNVVNLFITRKRKRKRTN